MLPIFCAMVHEIGRGTFEPLLDNFTNHHTESSYRATYGSLQSLLGRAGFAMTMVGVWWWTRGAPDTDATMTTVLAACGALLVVASVRLQMMSKAQPIPGPSS